MDLSGRPSAVQVALQELFDNYFLGAAEVAAEDQCPGQLQLELEVGELLDQWTTFLLRDGSCFRARWYLGVLQIESLPDEVAARYRRLFMGY